MRKFLLNSGLILASAILVFSGCDNDCDTPPTTTGVIVRSIMLNGDSVYAVVQQVQSYTPMDTVVVTDPTGSTYGLNKYKGDVYDFRKTPTDADYNKIPPKEGTFTYKVKYHSGTEETLTNSITAPFIAPAQNMSVTKITVNNSPALVIAWDAVYNAEAYCLEITKGSQWIYTSPRLFSLSNGMDGTLTYPFNSFEPYKGDTLLFKIVAYDVMSNSAINATSWATTKWLVQ